MPQEGSHMTNGVIIIPLPFFHAFGMVMGMCIPLMVGAKVVLMPSFDLVKFLGLIQSEKVTRAYCVPPIILALAKHPIIDKFDLSSLKACLSGAAPLGREIQTECARRLKCVVKQGWGMTELSPVATVSEEGDGALNGNCGQLLPATEAKIVDPITREIVSPRQLGELAIRGPQVMQGYLNNKAATDDIMMDGGFMRTGDIAYFDEEDMLYVVDRCKELIKYKGFQVDASCAPLCMYYI